MAYTTTWAPLNEKNWGLGNSPIFALKDANLLQYNSSFFVINPVTITSLGYTKTSVLSSSDMLSFSDVQTSPTFTTALTPGTSNTNYTQSAWSTGGWTITSAANFVHDVGIFAQNNGAVISPYYTSINIFLLFGNVGATAYALPIIYAGNFGTAT